MRVTARLAGIGVSLVESPSLALGQPSAPTLLLLPPPPFPLTPFSPPCFRRHPESRTVLWFVANAHTLSSSSSSSARPSTSLAAPDLDSPSRRITAALQRRQESTFALPASVGDVRLALGRPRHRLLPPATTSSATSTAVASATSGEVSRTTAPAGDTTATAAPAPGATVLLSSGARLPPRPRELGYFILDSITLYYDGRPRTTHAYPPLPRLFAPIAVCNASPQLFVLVFALS